MRVLHVMRESLPNIIGYTIRAKYLLEAQAGYGNEVHVLTSPDHGESLADEKIAGVTYHRSGYFPIEKLIARWGGKQLVFGRAITRRLRELILAMEFDVVHVHTPFTLALPVLAIAKRHSIPVVYEKRNLWEESAKARGKYSGRAPFYQLSQMIDRYATRSADAVCVITGSLKQHTVNMGVDQDKIIIVQNGVDIDKFGPKSPNEQLRNKCLNGGKVVIGFIGSFFKFEGLPLLVNAFAELAKRNNGIRLVLVGNGEDMPAVEQAIKEQNIEEKVLLTGRVSHDMVNEYYQAIDIFVYPRLLSTLTNLISPLKPLEPMAIGKVVIGSNVGGLRDLISNGSTGLIFKAGIKEDLVNKLAMVINGKVDCARLAAQARGYVCNHRQWKIIAKEYEVAYERARQG